MSFLAGRLAGKEAAYFFQESKHAVNRLTEKSSTTKNTNTNSSPELESSADVLPEILRHSLPSKIFGKPSESSSLSTGSKWTLEYDPNNAPVATPDILNPLRAYLSLPQVTFGPKRWKLPSQDHTVIASTANEMRRDRFDIINYQSEKVKAASEGLTRIGQAIAIATATVFGGATLVFALAASKLELQNISDIRTKVSEVTRPKFEMINERVIPLKIWAEGMTKKWHIDRKEDIKEKPLVKELSKLFNVKTA